MALKLADTEVKSWLRGQRRAGEWIEAERTRVLLKLTPEQSQLIFLSLHGTVSDGRSRKEPSPLLWKMRKALEFHSRRRAKRPS